MDLIERLRARANEERAVPDMGHNAAERERSKLIRLLTEAADALEDLEAVRLYVEQAAAARGDIPLVTNRGIY